HVRIDSSAGPGSIPGEVEVLEPLGGQVLVHWRTAVGPLVSRVDDEHAPAIGARAGLGLDWDSAHFFSADTEQVIAPASWSGRVRQMDGHSQRINSHALATRLYPPLSMLPCAHLPLVPAAHSFQYH